MDTTVVFFPGMGYGVDRPLFYYARKQAQQTGSEVVCVDYPSFSPDPAVRLTKIPGANHSLEVPGDIVTSVDALRQVAQLYRAVL